jgi:hypothetical protein
MLKICGPNARKMCMKFSCKETCSVVYKNLCIHFSHVWFFNKIFMHNYIHMWKTTTTMKTIILWIIQYLSLKFIAFRFCIWKIAKTKYLSPMVKKWYPDCVYALHSNHFKNPSKFRSSLHYREPFSFAKILFSWFVCICLNNSLLTHKSTIDVCHYVFHERTHEFFFKSLCGNSFRVIILKLLTFLGLHQWNDPLIEHFCNLLFMHGWILKVGHSKVCEDDC